MASKDNGFDSWMDYITDAGNEEPHMKSLFSKIINIHVAYQLDSKTPREIAEEVDLAIEKAAKAIK